MLSVASPPVSTMSSTVRVIYESDEESIPELVPADDEYDEYERITAVEYSELYAAFEASFDSLLAG